MHDDLPEYGIVADIGGTNARFARVNLNNLRLDKIEIFPCAVFATLEIALATYQTLHSLQHIKRIVIAIACPVSGDMVKLTNSPWQFSIKELKSKVNLEELQVVNDFYAIAAGLPALSEYELIKVGGGQPDCTKPKVVLGAGTGLGVAYVVPSAEGYTAYAGEGGHANWGASTEQEWFIYNHIKNQWGHVSQERLLSGHGLENIYMALNAYNQQEVPPLSAAEIISTALAGKNPVAEASVNQFFISLGSYAGDLALTLGAFGGLYLAGGIIPRLLSFIQGSPFRASFESKGRFQAVNHQIPTYAIAAEQPGMLGAAVLMRQSMQGVCNA